jgi:hypothetical protein
VSDDEKFIIPEELEEWIGLKKSEYLSVLIQNMIPEDFGFEDFHLYDEKLPDTVESPDRSFVDTVDGHLLQTFVRTYSDEKMFHHVVIGTTHVDKKNELEAFLPIISFVTRSEEVVGIFSVGRCLQKPTMN